MTKRILIFLIFFGFPLLVMAGRESGGGDLASMQFKQVAEDVVRALEENRLSTVAGVELTDLKNVIVAMEVESTDQSQRLGGLNKDAINYPDEKRIVFNRDRWAVVNQTDRRQFVLHEVLGLMRLNDKDYELSRAILKLIENVPSSAPYANLVSARCRVMAAYYDPERGTRFERFNTRIELSARESWNPSWFDGEKSVLLGKGNYRLMIKVAASPYGYTSHSGFQGVTEVHAIVATKSNEREFRNLAKATGSSDQVSNRYELEWRKRGDLTAEAELLNPKDLSELADSELMSVKLSCKASEN